MDVRFVDTTIRDGSQSLWALRMRGGMVDAVAEPIDMAGFAAVEVLVGSVFMKKAIRELRENPWDIVRLIAKKMPRTTKTAMVVGNVLAFEKSPHELYELYYKRIVAAGALNRVQIMANTADELTRDFPFLVPLFKGLGVQVVPALCYTISPRHTDAYYAETTRRIAAFKPDAIYIKDAGGLLTVDRIRTLVPAVLDAAGGLPVELHSHCTTGLAPLVYLEALKLGIGTLHTAIPPLANGSSQPSVFNVAHNAKLLGHTVGLDIERLRPVSERLTRMARQEGLPIGAPLEYDYSQYIHQVPGGVISNLMHQLKTLRLEHRVDEVLAESVHVRKDLGYPMMITPHSQYVVTQAAINVATGERYKLTIDELVRFAQGMYGEDSGYKSMDQNLKDRLLSQERARELGDSEHGEVTIADLRKRFGGPGVDDEEFLMRYIMKGADDIAAMRAAGPPRQYFDSSQSLLTLVEELNKRPKVRFVHIQRDSTSVLLSCRTEHPRQSTSRRPPREEDGSNWRTQVKNITGVLDADDVEAVTRLIDSLNGSSCDFLQVEIGDMKLSIGKGAPPVSVDSAAVALTPSAEASPRAVPAPAAPVPVAAAPMAATKSAPAGAPAAEGVPIKASIMGRFYAKPDPADEPFVSVGSVVDERTTVALVEVMKMFTPVEAGVRGVITEVCVADSEMVEFGQTLFRVKPQ